MLTGLRMIDCDLFSSFFPGKGGGGRGQWVGGDLESSDASNTSAENTRLELTSLMSVVDVETCETLRSSFCPSCVASLFLTNL